MIFHSGLIVLPPAGQDTSQALANYLKIANSLVDTV
jgi:hypothetical protein